MKPRELGRLVIVDDHSAQTRSLCETLQREGYMIKGFASAVEALGSLRPDEYDVLIADRCTPDMDVTALIRSAQTIDCHLAVIVLSGQEDIDCPGGTTNSGSIDCVRRPFTLTSLRPVIDRAVSIRRLSRENTRLRECAQHSAEELAAAHRALESFSHSVSHDLKAPLRAVSSLVQIMQEDYGAQLDVEGCNVLALIVDSCQRMDELIAGLLAFSQSTSQPLERVTVDMTALARSAWNEIVAVHTGPTPSLEITALPETQGDVHLLRQVWRHLLANAAKYSSKCQAPLIRVTGHTEAAQCVYEVNDNGVGFDMKHAHRLFGVFQRLHRTEEYPGVGVGLAIVHRVLSRHGGRIRAESRPDSHTSFHFVLPWTGDQP
jgi:signal transduction histidine kinase